MDRTRIGIAVVLVAVSSLAIGCSGGNLDRSKAATLLRQHDHTKRERTIFFILDKLVHLGGERGAPYRALEKAGYLVISEKHWESGTTELAPRGQEAAAKNNWAITPCEFRLRCIFIPIAAGVIIEVTGIAQREKVADADFTWKWQLTPVGEELSRAGLEFQKLHSIFNPFDPTVVLKGRAAFSLYDDGWRLRDIQW